VDNAPYSTSQYSANPALNGELKLSLSINICKHIKVFSEFEQHGEDLDIDLDRKSSPL